MPSLLDGNDTTNPSGNGGGSLLGTGSNIAVSRPANPAIQFIRNAVRVARAAKRLENKGGIAALGGINSTRIKVANNLATQLADYSNKDIRAIAAKAKLQPQDVDTLIQLRKAGSTISEGLSGGRVLDYLQRPAQAVKGSIVEGEQKQLGPVGIPIDPLGALKGAAKGFTGQKQYSGTRALLQVSPLGLSKNQKELKKIEGKIPEPVRIGTDIIGDVAFDPLTYVSFGGGKGATTGASSIAKIAVGQAAEDAVMSPGAIKVFNAIRELGVSRGLASQIGEDAAAKLLQQIPSRVVREASKAQPGMYLAGQRVLGPGRLSEAAATFGPKATTTGEAAGTLGRIERYIRPRAGIRQMARAGQIEPSLVQSAEMATNRLRAAKTLGELAGKRATTEAAYAVGKELPSRTGLNLGVDAAERGALRRGANWVKNLTVEQKRRIYAALDVSGGTEAVAALPDLERTYAQELRRIADRTYEANIAAGRILPSDEALQAVRDQIGKQFAGDIEKATAKSERLAAKVAKRSEKLSQVEERLAASQARDQELADQVAQGVYTRRGRIQIDRLNDAEARQLVEDLKTESKLTDNAVETTKKQIKSVEGRINKLTEPVRNLREQLRNLREQPVTPGKTKLETLSRIQRAKNALRMEQERLTLALNRMSAETDLQVKKIVDEELRPLQERLANDIEYGRQLKEGRRQAELQAKATGRRAAQDLPREPGKVVPGISKQTAKLREQRIKVLMELSAAQKSAGKSTKVLDDLISKMREAKSAAQIIEQEQYIRRYPSEEARTELMRRGATEAAGGFPGRAPGYLKGRTYREAATGRTFINAAGEEVPFYNLDPGLSVARAAKESAIDLARIRSTEDLLQMTRPVVAADGSVIQAPIFIRDEQQIRFLQKTDPTWRVRYKEVKMPLPADVQASDAEMRLLDSLGENLPDEELQTLVDETGKRYRTVERRMLVDRAIADDIEQAFARLSSGRLKRFVMYVNALWARYATGTIGFVSRNVVQGNLFLGMWLAGADNPLEWARTLGTMKRAGRGMARFGDWTRYLKPDEIELVNGAVRDGVLNTNFQELIRQTAEQANVAAGTGIGGRVGKALRTSKFSPVSPEFAATERIGAANQWFENWSRLSVYRNKIAQGFAPPEAASITNYYMLNYQDLSKLNDKARMFNPFITWTYKTVPMIAGTLVRDPKKITIPLAVTRAIGASGERTEGVNILPDWMKQTGGVVLPKFIREKLPFGFGENPQVLSLETPIQTAARAVQPVGTALGAPFGIQGSLNEAARQLYNVAPPGGLPGAALQGLVLNPAGYQPFTGRQIPAGSRVPTPLPLRPILGPTMAAETYAILAASSPLVSRFGAISPQNDQQSDAQARQLLSMLGGISLYPYTNKTKRATEYQRKLTLDALIRSLRDRGITVPSKSRTIPTPTDTGGGQSLIG